MKLQIYKWFLHNRKMMLYLVVFLFLSQWTQCSNQILLDAVIDEPQI